jgi:hypothetical protein
MLADLLGGLLATPEGFGNPFVGPVWTVGIRVKHHLGAEDLLTGSVELLETT